MNETEIRRLSDFLRESIDGFMELLDIEERVSPDHEEQVHYEEWVRYLLTTNFLPDVLATMCGLADYDADLLNKGVPDLLKQSLWALPQESAFIAAMMARLPDHPRMALRDNRDQRIVSLADEARLTFDAALYITLGIGDDAS